MPEPTGDERLPIYLLFLWDNYEAAGPHICAGYFGDIPTAEKAAEEELTRAWWQNVEIWQAQGGKIVPVRERTSAGWRDVPEAEAKARVWW